MWCSIWSALVTFWAATIGLGAGSVLMATYGDGPRISLALWARPLVASTVAAATAAAIRTAVVIKSWRLSRLTTPGPNRVRIVNLPSFVCADRQWNRDIQGRAGRSPLLA